MEQPLDGPHTALLLFDTLNGHLKTGPDRTIAADFVPAVSNIARLLDAVRAAGGMIVYAAGAHRADDGMQRQTLTDVDNRLRPWTGPKPVFRQPIRAGDWTGQVIDELAPRPEDYVVPKYRWSAFTGTYLDMALRVHGIGTIVLVGGSTDVGLASTAFSARDLDYDLVVARDACTAHEMDNHEQFMRRIFPRMARVRDTAAIIAMLKGATS